MSEAITRYLQASGSDHAPQAEALYAAAYAELRSVAARQRGRMPGIGGSNTSLVHEAFIKLRDVSGFADRGHFLATATRAMRQILVDLARAQATAKRGGGRAAQTLTEAGGVDAGSAESVLDVDVALRALADEDADLARLVELRFFGGLELAEIAEALGRSSRSLKRDWVKARAFLRQHIGDGTASNAEEGEQE